MSCLLEVLNEHGRAEHSPISRENRPLNIPRANAREREYVGQIYSVAENESETGASTVFSGKNALASR